MREEGYSVQENERRRFNWQPILVLLLITLLVVVFMVWNTIFMQGKILHHAQDYYMQERIGNMTAGLEQVEQEGQNLTGQIANNAKLQAAFQQGNHEQLNKLLPPIYKQWESRYDVKELDLISTGGSVVWSSNHLLSAGDDLSYQRIVHKSLQEKVQMSAAESGETDNLIVTTLPLFSGDEYIGLCKVGISMQSLGKKLQKLDAGKYAIYNLNGIESSLVWQNKRGELLLNTADLKKLHDGQTFSKTLDRKTILAIIPIKDNDGVCIAYMQGQISIQTFRQARQNNFILLLLIAVFTLLASYILTRGQFHPKEDYANGFVNLPKINSVAFNIDSEKGCNHTGEDQ
jgi:hypothetical protein